MARQAAQEPTVQALPARPEWLAVLREPQSWIPLEHKLSISIDNRKHWDADPSKPEDGLSPMLEAVFTLALTINLRRFCWPRAPRSPDMFAPQFRGRHPGFRSFAYQRALEFRQSRNDMEKQLSA